jgi:hypothetical protein
MARIMEKWSKHQTTNLGVRGSNLFGRAINDLRDRQRSNERFRTVFRTAISGTDAEDRRPSDGRIRKAVAAVVPNLAKVGVEGSNPFARSNFLQGS